MTTKTHQNRVVSAIANFCVSPELQKEVRFEQDWIGNIYIKVKGARIAPLIATFAYSERHLAESELKEAGFIPHPTKRGLGGRKIWVRPANMPWKGLRAYKRGRISEFDGLKWGRVS
jgi:hypothetical protein